MFNRATSLKTVETWVTEQNSTDRILLVEDNDANRQLLSDYLIYCGYTLSSLSGGTGFFEALEEFQPHLVLLDLKLPDIDGYTLLGQLQQKPTLHDIPVIVVSAFAFQADQQRALQLGVCRYFVKPVNLNHLKQAIQEELHGAESTTDDNISDNLTLDNLE